MPEKKPKLKPQDIQTLKVWAGNSMSRKKTAAALYRAPTGLDYRLDSIKKRTGLNPKNFFDLNKLLMMIREQEEHEQTDRT